MHHESNFAYDEILNAATLPSQPYGSLVPTAVKGRLSMVRRVPVGRHRRDHAVELADRARACASSAPALALGNAVVLKPDPQTPVIGGAMFAAVFREAGLPEGLLQVVVGGADVGEALVTDPNIPVVSFTGSTAVGRRVGELAGRHAQEGLARARRATTRSSCSTTRTSMPRPRPARFSSFQFQGQVCFAAGRHIVHESLADRLHRRACREGEAPATGDPYREDVQLGPIVNEKQVAPGRRHRPALDRRRRRVS